MASDYHTVSIEALIQVSNALAATNKAIFEIIKHERIGGEAIERLQDSGSELEKFHAIIAKLIKEG